MLGFIKMSDKDKSHKKKKDYDLFPISKPWGYYPDAVNKKIVNYENALRSINGKLSQERTSFSMAKNEYEEKLKEKDQEIERLKQELWNMNLQMSKLELPEADYGVSYAVLDEFKNYNSRQNEHNVVKDKKKITNNKKNQKQVLDGKEINIVS